MVEAFVVGGVRTPIGRYGGALAAVRPDDLAALVLRELVSRAGIDPAGVNDVVVGAANQPGEGNRQVRRAGGGTGLATVGVGVGQDAAHAVEGV